MVRLLSALALAATILAASIRGDEPTDNPNKKPITTDTGEVGKLLTRWYKEGTAAGNVGDWYDNRDGEHSPLDIRTWPQLQKVKYTEADIKARRNWALQPRVLPHVVFGNSSTSAPAQLSGSNPRSYYCSGQGLALLQAHYARNNLYIYPEHRDHDPGHNGIGDGYGDLYPTNTPFLLISQGSSGSDQPFMRAVPFALAAFRPDVKKKLIDTGLLMPTLQMAFRSTNRHLKNPDEYFTGKAHPSVFEGAWVDPLALVRKAHSIRLDDVPPLVKLAVAEEDAPVAGRDYFEPAVLTEKLADTPTVIARVWRGASGQRRLVVRAGDSIDLNKRPLTFRWVVLRGDAKRIRITPANRAGSEAEVVVAYHERRPVAPGSTMASNRVDIGVFASNGVHTSAPAFLTFFSLDSEARTYDAGGRIVEVGHGTGVTELKAPDPVRLLAALGTDALPAKLLGLSAAQRNDLAGVAKKTARIDEQRAGLSQKRKDAEAARDRSAAAQRQAEQKRDRVPGEKKDAAEVAEATRQARAARDEAKQDHAAWEELNRKVAAAEAALKRALDQPSAALPAGALPTVMRLLSAAVRSPGLWHDHPDLARRLADGASPAGRQRVLAARAKLVRLGVIADGKGDGVVPTPIRAGERLADRLTAFERAMLEEFHGVALAELALPGLLQAVFHTNFVDARLGSIKRWRDVYHYQGDALAGWTRHHLDGKRAREEFTAEGWRVVRSDEAGRPVEARPVEYRLAPPPRGTLWANPNPLAAIDAAERITLTYEAGRRKVKREKAKAP